MADRAGPSAAAGRPARLLRRKVRRDVRARAGQFVAITLTVVLGIALSGASGDAYRNLRDSYDHLFEVTRFPDLFVTGADPQLAETLASDPSVMAVAQRHRADVPMRIGDREFVGQVVGLPESGDPPLATVLVLDGAWVPAPDAALGEQHLFEGFDVELGDAVEVFSGAGMVPVRLTGRAASAEYLWPAKSRQELFVSLDRFGVLFMEDGTVARLPGAVRQVLVDVRDDDPEAMTRLRALAIAHGATAVYDRSEQPSNAVLQEDVQGFSELSGMFAVLFLGAAAMALYVMLTRMVHQERPIVATLRANGFSRRQVIAHYLTYGLAVGVVGSTVGALIGAGLAGLVTRLYTSIIDLPVALVRVHPLTIVTGIASGIVAGGLSALAPARAAVAIPPAQALRGWGATVRGRISLFERIVPPLRRAPARTRFVLRSIGRNRRRSIATVLGVTAAVTLVMVSLGMRDTTIVLLERQFVDIQREDAQLLFARAVSAADLDTVESDDAVAVAEIVAPAPVSLQAGDRIYDTILTGFAPATSMHRFYDADGHETTLPGDGVLLGSAARERLDVEVGTPITVVSAVDPRRRFETTVAGFVDEPLGTPAYATIETVVAGLGRDTARAIAVRYGPGVDPESAIDRLDELDGVVAVTDTKAVFRIVQRLLRLFDAFIFVMLLFGAVMALAILYTTMSANVSERTAEVATLRASGFAHRDVARAITGENLLLVVLGLVPGLAVAYAVSSVFMAAYSNDMFSFDLHLRPITPIAITVTVVATAMLSQVPAMRAIRRIDLGRFIRERSL